MIHAVDLANPRSHELVVTSLIDSGFAVVENHPIDQQSLIELYNGWDESFVAGECKQYEADAESQNGYFSPDQSETAKGFMEKDLKEFFQYRPGCEMPPNLRDITAGYFDALFALGQTVLTWIQEQTSARLWQSLDRSLADWLDYEQTMLRILRYPPLTGTEPPGAVRAAAHEDINFITLLPAANKPGLEIKPRGEAWSVVDAPPGSIIINIGDMLQELTGGALPSTTHRVINPEPEDTASARLTAPVFCHPYDELVLSERYTAGQYLHERLAEINPEGLVPGR